MYEGGLKAQLSRTAQGKRSDTLGSHMHVDKRSQATGEGKSHADCVLF